MKYNLIALLKNGESKRIVASGNLQDEITSYFDDIASGFNTDKEHIPFDGRYNVGEDEYKKIKNNKENYPAHLVGFVGFGCSFSSMWFSSYAKGGYAFNGKPRNHANESRRNILKQALKIKNVRIKCNNYLELRIPSKSIIYCDPPYLDTIKYTTTKDFDSDVFWQWCRDKTKEGHQVFISEYNSPDDFKCIWSKEILCTTSQKTYNKRIEKLFVYREK